MGLVYVPLLQHVDKLLERSQHEHEMQQLKREKEAALAEEVKTTKAGTWILSSVRTTKAWDDFNCLFILHKGSLLLALYRN